MVSRKLRASAKAILTVLDKELDWTFIPSKSETIRRLKNTHHISFEDAFLDAYYSGGVRQVVEKLRRNGHVKIRETNKGTEVKISDLGRSETLKYKLDDLRLIKHVKWDGKWRLVMFDVEEMKRSKRDELRRWLQKLGLKRIQMSVWIYPYPLESELKFLREIVGIADGVKLALVEKIDNEEDLRDIFEL